jgi:hypothetical protein
MFGALAFSFAEYTRSLSFAFSIPSRTHTHTNRPSGLLLHNPIHFLPVSCHPSGYCNTIVTSPRIAARLLRL